MAAILVADDDPLTRLMLRAAFRHLGQDTLEAASGATFRAMVRRHTFGLVIMDAEIPGDDLSTRLQDARRTQPGARIVVLTGYPSSRIADAASAADLVLQKPVDLAALSAVLDSANLGTPPNTLCA